MSIKEDTMNTETPYGGEQSLNEQQLSSLVHFKDISGIAEDDVAMSILQANDWDLEKTVNKFMGYGDLNEASVRRRTERSPPVEISPHNQHVYHTPPPHIPWYMRSLYLIFAPFRIAYRIIWNVIDFFLPIVYPDSRRLVTDAAGDVRNFIDSFKKKYVPSLDEIQSDDNADVILLARSVPPFYNGTYGDALRDAKQSLRFLVVYVHGDSHENTDIFCRKTLLNPTVLSVLYDTDNIIFWGCNVNSPEGYRISQIMKVHSYPFIGVVALSTNPAYSNTSFGSFTRMALLGRIEGLTSAEILVQNLKKIMDDHKGVLIDERESRAERELSMRLRQEQDDAFAVSLAQDRAKMTQRAASEEAAARLALEAKHAQRRNEMLNRARLRRQRRWVKSLPEQPSPSRKSVCLSTKLPNGQRAQRLFALSDSVKLLYYFIISQEGAPKRFIVESNYPKRLIECRPGDESDIEEYMPKEECCDEDDDWDKVPCKILVNWHPNGTTDPPSFEDVGLIHSEMLLIFDLDS